MVLEYPIWIGLILSISFVFDTLPVCFGMFDIIRCVAADCRDTL